jgi:hypothetical protein
MLDPNHSQPGEQGEGNPLPPPSKSLSEIGHLFLSSIRQRQGDSAAPRPQRRPPGAHLPPDRPSQASNVSIDLTPEEFNQVFSAEDAARLDAHVNDLHEGLAADEPLHAPVTAVLASHFNGSQVDRVRAYARHLASSGRRIGLIEVDASELRLMCFDGHAHGEILAGPFADNCTDVPPAQLELEAFDPRQMAEALEEMSWDVEQWLLLLPSPRLPEARALLRDVSQWVLLSTCDHDGVVSAYRALKGLIEDVEREAGAVLPQSRRPRPRLSLAVMDAHDGTSAERIHRKLAGVCSQFLGWSIQPGPFVGALAGVDVAENLVLCCRPTRDKSQLGTGAQWRTVGDFIARARTEQAADAPQAPVEEELPSGGVDYMEPKMVEPLVSPEESRHFAEPMPIAAPEPLRAGSVMHSASAVPPAASEPTATDDVIDLIGGDDETSVLTSVLRHDAGRYVECPIAPPMRATARLAVGRDHRLVMLSVARQGLADLRAIGLAYRWLVENRALIAMAVPQLAIDAHAMPHLNLLVDQHDLGADILQPLLGATHVTLQSYRKLRWAGRTGLLLQAA